MNFELQGLNSKSRLLYFVYCLLDYSFGFTCRPYESGKLKSGKDAQFKPRIRNILDFSHPNLEYLIAESVYSPYNIKPREKYPKETYVIADKIRDLKNKGLKFGDIPPEERPFDVNKLRESFVHDVVLYQASYLAKPKVANDYKRINAILFKYLMLSSRLVTTI